MSREYVPAFLAEQGHTERYVLFHVVPEDLEISASPRYAEPAPLGRPEPYRVWMYNEPLNIKFNITFFTVNDVYRDVAEPITQLLAWAYPDTITAEEGFSMTTPPRILILRVGTFINKNVIIRNIRISPHPDSPWRIGGDTLWPDVIKVDLDLQVVSEPGRPLTKYNIEGRRTI